MNDSEREREGATRRERECYGMNNGVSGGVLRGPPMVLDGCFENEMSAGRAYYRLVPRIIVLYHISKTLWQINIVTLITYNI